MLLLLIFATTILFRYLTAEYIDIGGDNSTVFFGVKHLIATGGFPTWNHHTARWSVTMPLYAIMHFFGTEPRLYYVLPFLFSGIGSVLIYILGERLGGKFVGTTAFLLLLVFPQMAQTGSQLWPSVFQFPAALLAIYLIYLWADKGSTVYLFLSACVFFYTWGARISAIYYFPGLLLIIWLECRRLRPVLFFCIVAAGCFLLETAVLWTFTENPLGKIGIVIGSHLGTMEPISLRQYLMHFTALIKFKGLLPIYLLTIGAAIYAWKKGDTRWKGMAGFYLIASLLSLYMVSSIHPLRLAQPQGTRYWCQLAPFGLLLAAWLLQVLHRRHPRTGLGLVVVLFTLFLVFSIKRIPPKNALTQMRDNQAVLAPALGHNARFRLVWHSWTPGWLEARLVPAKLKSRKPLSKPGALRKMKKQAYRMMAMYAPVGLCGKQDYKGFALQSDGSWLYTPVGVAPDAPVLVDVDFDRRNCFISRHR